LGSFDSDGYLYLTGRSKEIINRGGEKIAPREVEDVLTQHDAVAQAAAFAIPHPTLGEEVAAAVVLRRESQATESEIREFVAARLAAFKAPKQLLILDQIPKGPTGKVQRIGLADKLAKELAAKRESGFVAGSDPVEIELAGIWKRLLKVERVGVHDEFHALGGDSLAMTVMLNEVEERFHTRIPVDQFLRRPTVSTLALAIQGKPTEAAVQEEPAVKDSFLRGMKNRLLQLIALYAPGYKSTRVWLNRMRGVTIGTNTSIGLSALIESAYPSLVSIGDNVTIGTRAIIIGHLRDFTDSARSGNRKTVRIEDEVYLGPGAIVLPNVTIGKGAVVSAGSVVTRSVPPRTLVQGNPAKPVARCGVSLGGGVSYEQFIRHLTPIDGQSSEPGAEPR
jgi:acetyltransferase-like isoleucine patch superfamily enzyme/acyl carrier protein